MGLAAVRIARERSLKVSDMVVDGQGHLGAQTLLPQVQVIENEREVLTKLDSVATLLRGW